MNWELIATILYSIATFLICFGVGIKIGLFIKEKFGIALVYNYWGHKR